MPLKNSARPIAVWAILIALFGPACARPPAPVSSPTPSAPPASLPPAEQPRLVPPPAVEKNQVRNGGFEEIVGDLPAGWTPAGGSRAGARIRSVAIPGAPEGQRVAEISLGRGGEPGYGLHLEQRLRLDYTTTYDLSIWVRGIDLVSETSTPFGFGRECGLFFWIYGPAGDRASRVFPSGAYPAADGTTGWALRTMRFTTPPREAFAGAAGAAPGGDARLQLQVLIQLYGTGTIQVDDLRLARSEASPPPARRSPGELAFAMRSGGAYFGLGLYRLPKGITFSRLAQERIFNLTGGAGEMAEKRALGLSSMVLPLLADPACTGCGAPGASECAFCRLCPDDRQRCGSYRPEYLKDPGGLIWVDEPNANPEIQGDLEDLIASARRIREQGAKLRPAGEAVQILSSDMPGGVYYNTYGWDDLARYHRSDAFDIISVIRRGGNPPPSALGGVMSMYPQTGTSGTRNEARRLADDVTGADGRQSKPVWLLVNGGSGRIVRDRADPDYRSSPHDAGELLAMRPDRSQLRAMLYAAIANGVTGLVFYQDEEDTLLTPEDPYWKGVLLPAAAELATLEKETGFLTVAPINRLRYRLTGDSDGVDSLLKRTAGGWILLVASTSLRPLAGVELQLQDGKIESAEKLEYRHDPAPQKRRFRSVPALVPAPDRLALDLPGYGVGIYRLHLAGDAASSSTPPASR